MNFFAWPNPHNRHLALWADGLGNVEYSIRGYFWDENFAALGIVNCPENHRDAFFQRNIKTCHPGVRNRKHSQAPLFLEKGNDRTSASHYVTVSDDAETYIARS